MLMETKLISLTKENEEMLDEIVKSGMYATKSEVIRDAVRKLYADILRLKFTKKLAARGPVTRAEKEKIGREFLAEIGLD